MDEIEASRRGAALLALRGAGLLADRDSIPALPVRIIQADADRAARYRAARTRQRELYEALVA